MVLLIECIILCHLLAAACYLGTGTDKKNIKSFYTYPDKVQQRIRENPEYAFLIPKQNPVKSFIGNLTLFTALLTLGGLIDRADSFAGNLLHALILGEVLNAFDFFVIDLLWWRNTKRVRIKGAEDRAVDYRLPQKHLQAFWRGTILFALAALFTGGILAIL